ncbi:CDP-diacylglycerol--serine O-phosphatidyltransferase [Algoriphagus sp.]|uniref:CDP-diacylglycerol--serine O-phosphatidyltransferase n=1 Tax=Algoriphagus sp. TaxID=1872435 RepID=UPI0026211259|nr:CDP-diacylglycerol--serine O-phosphatidyltransferase [Algoriphagus sp.]
MKLKSHIPNTLTLLNLLSGIIGIHWVIEGEIFSAAWFIILSAFFDFLDGFAARMLQVTGELGKQLDSLADLVSFGVLPGFVLFSMCEQVSPGSWLAYFTLTIPLFSALRLAMFNLDTRQSDRFIGLPTPANALFISTLPYLFTQWIDLERFFLTPWAYLVLAGVLSFLLVAEIPLIALKFKNFSFKKNVFRYVLIGFGIGLILAFGLAGIPLIILSYLILSLVENSLSKA